jgi:hypothetical protein
MEEVPKFDLTDEPTTSPAVEVPAVEGKASEPIVKPIPSVKVVTAPVTTGICFKVHKEQIPGRKAGQLLVLIDRRFGYLGAMNVVKTYFPGPEESGYIRDVIYLGLKVNRDHFEPASIDMMIEGNNPMKYRINALNGYVKQDWREMDLSRVKLRTTEEQRMAISAFAGIIYRAEDDEPKKFIGILDAAGVSPRQLKDRLKGLPSQGKHRP